MTPARIDPARAPTPTAVAVVAASAAEREAAQSLARSLGLPFAQADTGAPALRLVAGPTRLELVDAASGARLFVEIGASELRRYRAGGPGGDPLRRAIGPAPRSVADATAGLGRDAVHLAALGYRVTAIERSLVAGALVRDGLMRARASGLLPGGDLEWISGDARVVLPGLDPPPDTVYLDPMFPEKRKKSAAARKEMRLLRLLGGGDNDAQELLAVARGCARERVVVKRPMDAAPLAPGANATYRGKLVRYDVYRPLR